jgi:predicted secreted Zn-dependent protease
VLSQGCSYACAGARRPPPAWLGTLLLAGLACLGTARADLAEHLAYSYYDVPYYRGMALRELLDAATPVHEEGRSFHAHTTWHVNWHYQYRTPDGGGCAIESVQTELTATIVLPAPADPAIAHDPAFVTYLAALKVHEQGHYHIGLTTAAAIDAGILALSARADCATLGAAANELANAQLARARQVEDGYDRDTGHGRTQGATLR